MKKIFAVLVAVACIFAFSSCATPSSGDTSVVENPASFDSQQTDSSEVVNPLKDKEYEELNIDSDEDFAIFLSKKIKEYSELTTEWKNYIEKHTSDLENGKRFCDLNDFSEEFDGFYQWCYQITNYNSQQSLGRIPPCMEKITGDSCL